MYDSDDNVIPEDDEGNHLAQAELPDDTHSTTPDPLADVHLDDDDASATLEGGGSTDTSAETLPPALQQNISGVPRKIRNLQSFFNPNPQTEWNNIQGDSDSDTALIATMYDGIPEPKTYSQVLKCSDIQNWWGAMCVEFKNMEDKQVCNHSQNLYS
jgi:hypothetical protein